MGDSTARIAAQHANPVLLTRNLPPFVLGLQGRTYASGGVKDELAEAIREFNAFVRQDARVEVVALPFRDGVSIITRRLVTGTCPK
jgi:hypothetical protein